MTLFFAVVSFALARGLVAGYAGLWFAPVVALEALEASWPFLVIGALATWMRSAALTNRASTIDFVEAVLASSWLFASVGAAWVEPHTSVSNALGVRAGMNWPLVAGGAAAGAVLAVLARRAGKSLVACALAALAGALILGPEIYAWFDDVRSARRLTAALGIFAGFAALALVFRALAARGAERPHALDALLGGAAALLLIVAVATPAATPAERPPSVLLVIVDTLRADSLDRTGAGGGLLMPRLGEIARAGVRFTQAVAPSPWTLPSVTTLLSGMNPHRHRVGRMHGVIALPGDARASWAAPALRSRGYQVAGFVNNPWLRRYYGVGPGYLTLRRYHGDAADGVKIALDWIRTHRIRPYVAVLHVMDPHWPYDAPEGHGEARRPCAQCSDLRIVQYQAADAELRNEVRRRYDAEVAYTDAQIGRLWDELGRRGALDDAWLIVTSDHGEEFWEHHGFLHGHSLYDELLRIPLIVVPPMGAEPARRGVLVRAQVRLEDVAATIFDIAGVQAPFALDGTSFLREYFATSAAAKNTAPPARPAVAGYVQQEGSDDWAVRANGMKLIVGAAPLPLLFDLQADPRETLPVTFQRPFVTAALSRIPAALNIDVAAPASAPDARPAAIDADLERELRALGYAH